MNPSLVDKLRGLRERLGAVGALLAEPGVASDPFRFRSADSAPDPGRRR